MSWNVILSWSNRAFKVGFHSSKQFSTYLHQVLQVTAQLLLISCSQLMEASLTSKRDRVKSFISHLRLIILAPYDDTTSGYYIRLRLYIKGSSRLLQPIQQTKDSFKRNSDILKLYRLTDFKSKNGNQIIAKNIFYIKKFFPFSSIITMYDNTIQSNAPYR